MKKIVAVLLSILMIFSGFSVLGFAADEKTEDGSLVDKITGSIDYDNLAEVLKIYNFSPDFSACPDLEAGNIDVEKIIDDEDLAKKVVIFPGKENKRGVSVYDLYYTSGPFFWGGLAGSTEESSIFNDFTLVKANINSYLLRLIKKQTGLGTLAFYNENNATKITNFIGHLVNADYEDIKITSSVVLTEDGFYSTIAKLSGLANVIQMNWLDNPKMNYTPVLNVLDYYFDDDDLLGTAKYKSEVIAKVLISSVFKRILEVGPLEYLLRVVSQMADSYTLSKYKPIEALFLSNVIRGNISRDELSTIGGLISLVFNSGRYEKVDFIEFPEYRVAGATKIIDGNKKATTDTTEMFFYAFMYLNLLGKHKNNAEIIDFEKNGIISTLEEQDAVVVNSIFDAFFKADVTGLLSNLKYVFVGNIDSVKPGISDGFMSFFSYVIKSFADFFERIINSFLHFGEF